MLKLCLEAIKFAAIAVTIISGLIGTLTDARDKETGRPTLWGKRIVQLIVISGLFAALSQAIETYLKNRADKESASVTEAIIKNAKSAADGVEITRERQENLLQELGTNVATTYKLRDKAEAIGRELDQQRASIGRTTNDIERTAINLESVLSAQKHTLDSMYAILHPLGTLRVRIRLHDAFMRLGEWPSRIYQASHAADERRWFFLDESDPLNPKPDEDEFSLLKQPYFDLTINRKPTQFSGDGRHLVPHSTELVFRTFAPQTRAFVNLGSAFTNDTVDILIAADTHRLIDHQEIASWRDLYGAELIIALPPSASPSARITECDLYFSGQEGGDSRTIRLRLDDSNLRWSEISEVGGHIASDDGDLAFLVGIFYVKILSETELGPQPQSVTDAVVRGGRSTSSNSAALRSLRSKPPASTQLDTRDLTGVSRGNVLALVDSDPILAVDLDRAIAFQHSPTTAHKRDQRENERVFRRRVLDDLIVERLRLHEIERVGFQQVSMAEIESHLATIRANFKDEMAFHQALAQTDLDEAGLRLLVAHQLEVEAYVNGRLKAQGTKLPSEEDLSDEDNREDWELVFALELEKWTHVKRHLPLRAKATPTVTRMSWCSGGAAVPGGRLYWEVQGPLLGPGGGGGRGLGRG